MLEQTPHLRAVTIFSSAVSSCLGSRPACSHAEEPAESR